MKAIQNFDTVEVMGNSGGNANYDLPAGGYVCRITGVEDFADKQYLRIEYDIAEGEYKDYGADTLERAGFTPCHYVRSYTKRAEGFFKGFINAIAESNPGFKWNWDESTLVDKLIGLTIGVEHYTKRDGSDGTRPYVDRNLSVARIRNGEFKVPGDKTAKGSYAPAPAPSKPTFAEMPAASDDDLPF